MPLRFNHQAVVRDLSGQVVAGQAIRLRVSLVQGVGIAATDRYVEIHQVVTNANGLFTLEVGGGSVVSGRMDSVEWALGQVYLRTEVDPTGGTNYLLSSNRELLSVPYALYAQQAQSASNIVGGGAGVLATVRTLGVTVRYTGALVEGSLDSDGGELVLSRGICVDTLPSPGTSKAVPHAGTGMGAYTVDLSGLTPGRTYYVRAYATTAAGTAFGQSLTLQTRALAVPAPVTLPATGLSAFGAQLRGELPDTSTGGLAVSSRGFRWSTASGFAPASGQDLAS
ncbi:MAG: hypothetical protein KGP34_08230, partial [Bacteroidetes bacterium]|nr:hypothetical protein [Bacteroidota bacterium]